jgi:hypothetical protein
MGTALITDVAVATIAAGPTITNAVAGQGSSLTVRNSALTSQVQLVDMWAKGATKGVIQLTSPKIVPVSHGITVARPAGLADFLLGGPPFQALTPQDNLTMMINGTAAEVDIGVIQSYYADLPGVEMQLKMPGDIAGQTEFVFGWEVATTASATPGNQNQTLITTTMDSSSANVWYAVLGYTVDTAIGIVGINGVDTSASTIAGPGDILPKQTRNYFADLSNRTGLPCIPLFNAANKGNTFVVTADSAASTTSNVTLILAQLQSNYTP